MKIQQLLIEQNLEDLTPGAKTWLEQVGIHKYDVIGPNTIDVGQDINWGMIQAPDSQDRVRINHVSGSFSWISSTRLVAHAGVEISTMWPKTVSGDCTIQCEWTGAGDTITTSTLPKGSGSGKLTLQGDGSFDILLNVDNNFTSTYSNYAIDVTMNTGSGKPLTILPSPWNSGMTVLPNDKSPLMLPNVINGKLVVYGNSPCFESFVKIHHRVKQIDGELYVQGVAPWPLLSLYRIKGIKQFSCGIWDVDDNGDVLDDNSTLSQQISRIFNKHLGEHSDVLEFQEALLDAGLKEWAK